jgi:hypothetical protein
MDRQRDIGHSRVRSKVESLWTNGLYAHYPQIIRRDVTLNHDHDYMFDYGLDVRVEHHVSPLVRLATLGVAMALVQCGDDAEQTAACECLADPVPRCIAKVEAECRDSSECASGLICRETPRSGKRCRAETQTSRPLDQLTAGFGVPRQRLVRGESERGPGVYHWSPVQRAEYVSCSLFACLPEVGVDARGLLSIVNYDKCVLARETVPVDPVVPFTVGGDSDTTYRPSKRVPAVCKQKPVEAARRITRLAVGCIAYNAIDLVAASQLLFVSPDETGTFGGTIPTSTACLNDQDECYDAEADSFGTCLDGACRARCGSAFDCCESLEIGAVDAGSTPPPDLAANSMVCPNGVSVECVLGNPPVIGACRTLDREDL